MKLSLSAALAHARSILRRWLRHTWISRLPLWGSFRHRHLHGRLASSTKQRRGFRPALEGLEDRLVPASAQDALAAPALLHDSMTSAAVSIVNQGRQTIQTEIQLGNKLGELLQGLVLAELAALTNSPLIQAFEQAEDRLDQILHTSHDAFEQLLTGRSDSLPPPSPPLPVHPNPNQQTNAGSNAPPGPQARPSGSSSGGSLTPHDPTIIATEGSQFGGQVATFTDKDGNTNPSMYAATINWGDHTPTSAGTINYYNGAFMVVGSHTYAEEGSYNVTVTITDTDGTVTTVTSPAYVKDDPLGPDVGGTLQATQGATFNLSGMNFVDPDPNGTVSDYKAVINWGDGATPTTGTVTATEFSTYTVGGSHVYQQAGNYTIQVTAIDQGGASITLQGTVTVAAPPLTYTPGSPTFVEGATPATQNLGTFTDPSNTDPTKYSATVNWGDNTPTSAASISYLGSNTFQISGTHGYAEEGSKALTITLTDSLTNRTETIPVLATVNDAALTASPLSVNATAGTFYSGAVATFTDANPNASKSDYTATINWGDGSYTSQDSGIIVPAQGGGFQVLGGHTYTTAGTYNVLVTINDVGGQSATTTSTVTVAVATQTLVLNNLSFTEGQSFNGALATYTPPAGSNGSYTAIIGWGDGSLSSGTLTANGSSYTISGSHTYSDETPAGQPYTLTITVQPAAGTSGTPLTASSQVTVSDAALTPTPLNLTGWTNTNTGNLVVGKFADANPNGSVSDFTASINWGDGSQATTGIVQTAAGGGFQVAGNHTYTTAGTYTVAITVTDKGGSSTLINSTLVVGTATTSITATEGNSYNGVVATLSGNVNNVTGVTITWGDGTQTSGTWSGNSSSFTVSGTHTYADEGVYALSVSVQMSQGGPLSASGPATVNDAALSATGVTLNATSGKPLITPPQQVVVATFTDANPNGTVSDFSATIDWGDGSPLDTGTIQADPHGGFDVLGNHTYASTSSSHTVTIVITDVGGSTATATSTVPVGMAEGQDYPLAIQVTAPGPQPPQGAYTATINWGDGSALTTAGVSVVAGSSPLQLLVTGDHVYTEEGGPYTVTVTVSDAKGNQTVSTAATVNVVDAPLSGYGLNVRGVAGGNTGVTTLGGFTDGNLYASASDFGVSINWGDGTPADTTTGRVTELSSGAFQVSGNHSYATAGTYTVTTIVTDDGGQITTFTSTATVAAPWSILANQTGQRANDPDNAQLVPVGEATVDVNQGGLRLSQALDFDQSPGTDVGLNPALVYNSATVSALPVIQLAVQGNPNVAAATQAVVQLTWGGVNQTPVTYSLTQPAGSVYLFSVQPNSPVTTSGVYNWSATITFTIPGQNSQQVTASGTAYVVARDSSAYGAGWGIDGISQLVVGATGVLRVTGQGDGRFFANNGSGGFTSPAEDFGTLVKNGDGSYTYTAKDQTKFNYSSGGYLTSVVDTHGLATTYQYDGQNRLVQVNAIDGGITTLTYDPTTGLLDTITEPGGRVVRLTHDSNGNLTQIQDVDSTTRTFTYANPSTHLLTRDQWSPLDASFSYNAASNQLTQVNLGLGSVYTIVPAASAGLGTTAATGWAWSSLTDGLNHETQYLLDPRGRLLEQIEPDGSSTTLYVLNTAGLPTLTVDALGRPTFDTYNTSGDLLQETAADGSVTNYSYDSTFHEVTQVANSDGVTANTYDPVTGDLLTSKDALGATTTYTYYQTNGKSNGLVFSVTTPTETGTATTYNYYDAARRLITSFDALGVPTYITYDANGNPATSTDVYGRTTQTVYSPKNQLLETIDPLGAVTSQTYNAYGEQTSSTDARGFTSTTSYDQRGWQTAQTDNLGNTTETDSYDAAGDLTEQTDADGNPTSYAYNADGELTQTSYADGSSSSESYDADGEVTSSTDQLGNTTTNMYNLVGEDIVTTDSLGRTDLNFYDEAGNVIRTMDPLGLATLNFYNADDEEIASAQQVSATVWAQETTQYDLAGETLATTDAAGHTTKENYNADGEESGSTDANGKTSTDLYDLAGNLIQSTDARGKVSTFYYNADNEQIAALDADGNLTRTLHDADGNDIETIDSKGTTTTTFNGDDEAVAVKDADGNVSQSFYDNAGNVIESIDANGKITRTWYNGLSEAVLSEDADGNFTQTVYNGLGEEVASTDGAGDLTQTGYDADGEETSSRDGDGNVTLFAFNADGQQISETDADNNTTLYLLDALGNAAATVDQLGNVTQAVYGLNGLLLSQTDALGRKITYGYDNDGNLLTEMDYNADGSVQDTKTFSYDNDGNLLTASNNYGTYTLTYDNNGNLLTRQDPFGLTLTYGYDGNNNPTSISDSLGGSITKVYDARNQLTSIRYTNGTVQARVDLTYTGDGQLATLKRYRDTAGSQLVSTSAWTYDATGNTKEIKHTSASNAVLGDYLYNFDAANRLSSETDTENGGSPLTTNYGYDASSQLTQAGANGYSYDANGNRTTSGYSTGPGNRLQSDGTWNYTYDAVGNTITKTNIATGEVWTFAWNDANQLTQATDKDVHNNLIQSVTLKYDVFGNKVEEDVFTQSTGQTVVTKFAFDADGNIWADLNSSNQLVMRRLFVDVNGQIQPLVRIDANGNVAWYLTDHLGSVRLLTDNNAAVLDQIDYDAYGNITSETNAVNGDRYKYASGQFQANLGMTLFGVRWESNGHWISSDPTGLTAGPNPYEAMGNDPTNAIDPSGLDYLPHFVGTSFNLLRDRVSGNARELARRAGSLAARDPSGVVGAGLSTVGSGIVAVQAGVSTVGGPIVGLSPTHNRTSPYNTVPNTVQAARDWWNKLDPKTKRDYIHTAQYVGMFALPAGPEGAAGELVGEELLFEAEVSTVAREDAEILAQREAKTAATISAPNTVRVGTAVTDEEVINAIRSVPTHYSTKASELPVVRPGTKAWEEAVEAIATGDGVNVRVPTATDAKNLLREARGNMNRYKRYTDKPYNKGYEMHPNESHTRNAPHNDLPHVKWKDWHSTDGGSGHIFFDKPN